MSETLVWKAHSHVCVCVCKEWRERLMEWWDINRSTDGEMDRWILMKMERQNKRDRKRLSLSLSVYPCLFSIFPLWPISGCHSIFHSALFSLTETYVNIKLSPSALRSPIGHIHNHEGTQGLPAVLFTKPEASFFISFIPSVTWGKMTCERGEWWMRVSGLQ